MKSKNLIVFDMDGVIIDVSASYRDVVRHTAGLFFQPAQGAEKLPDPLFDLADLAAVKQSGGLNNDWDLTYLVIKLLFSLTTNHNRFMQAGTPGNGIMKTSAAVMQHPWPPFCGQRISRWHRCSNSTASLKMNLSKAFTKVMSAAATSSNRYFRKSTSAPICSVRPTIWIPPYTGGKALS